MGLMALDHARDYLGPGPAPEDMDDPGLVLFFTRFVTHFCAPVFVFLAGVGAFFGGRSPSGPAARFLLARGLWLMLLEITLVHAGWWFSWPMTSVLVLQVIWVIGLSFVVLAGLSFLPVRYVLLLGCLLVGGHNLLDATSIEQQTKALGFAEHTLSTKVWAMLHVQCGTFETRPWDGGRFFLQYNYPLLPWLGIMLLGYGMGPVFLLAPERRRRVLSTLGGLALATFATLRLTGAYGDPVAFAPEENAGETVISFLNVEKYPPSLHYALVTLGTALWALVLLDSGRGWLRDRLVVLGRVPLFFYLLHVPLYNALGATWFWLAYEQSRWVNGMLVPPPRDFVIDLRVVYAGWILGLLIVWFPCRWFAGVKRRRRDWWLRYL